MGCDGRILCNTSANICLFNAFVLIIGIFCLLSWAFRIIVTMRTFDSTDRTLLMVLQQRRARQSMAELAEQVGAVAVAVLASGAAVGGIRRHRGATRPALTASSWATGWLSFIHLQMANHREITAAFERGWWPCQCWPANPLRSVRLPDRSRGHRPEAFSAPVRSIRSLPGVKEIATSFSLRQSRPRSLPVGRKGPATRQPQRETINSLQCGPQSAFFINPCPCLPRPASGAAGRRCQTWRRYGQTFRTHRQKLCEAGRAHHHRRPRPLPGGRSSCCHTNLALSILKLPTQAF